MNFLTAAWRKLILVNYKVNPELLLPYLPAGTELDLWEGNCYLSLVGFMFMDTRLLGLPIPFHRNFEEVNLRFYVKRKEQNEWKRGVVFIKEIVPKAALSLVANTFYREHYETRPMRHEIRETTGELFVRYAWKLQGWHRFSVTSAKEAIPIPQGSEAEFITEHYWGYTRINEHRTAAYEVMHPRWLQYPVRKCDIEVDFAQNYGTDFACLNHCEPASLLLAEGSPITVKPKKLLL